MRLIDADALLRDIEHYHLSDGKFQHWVEIQLTIEERKTGKWIPVDSYSAFGGDEVMWEAHGNPIAFYYCSECKEHAYAGEDGESLLTTYCPHCGARMVQEGEDNDC